MSSSKTRQFCLFSNRWVIYLFSLYGLFTGSITAYVIALTFWIWLAEFTRIEIKLFTLCRHKQLNLKKVKFIALIH